MPYPTRKATSMISTDLRTKLATGCRILAAEGHEHYFLGHVSVRVPGDKDQILVKPTGMGLGDVTAHDLIVINLDGQLVEGTNRPHQEMPIHTQIYRRRPDVNCVVHTHPPAASAFSASDAEFAFVSQDSVLFDDGVARYEEPQLIVTPEAGARVAEALGSRSVVVMRNHGITVVGSSAESAIFGAVSFERSLRVQLSAAQFAELVTMRPEDVRAMADYFATSYAGRVESAWAYLSANAARSLR